MGNQYIDFGFVKANADVETVLHALSIECIKRSGAEIRIHCVDPDHLDERASCDVNVQNKAFFCHSCKAQGSILDLVALVRGCDLREAAVEIADVCGIQTSSSSVANAKKQRSGQQAKGRFSSEGQKSPSEAASKNGNRSNETDAYVPFTTILKLDGEHRFGDERGFTPEQIKTYAMGYQDRGMFKGRWCMPIHDHQGNQLGYIGRYVKKTVPKEIEKWLLPPNFPKQDVLFNAHRIEERTETIVLVEGPFDVIRLQRLGFPSMALLGTSISERQIDILLDDFDVELIVVMLDGDAPGRKAVPALVQRLAQDFFVRDVKLPDGDDPETVAEDFLLEACWGVG